MEGLSRVCEWKGQVGLGMQGVVKVGMEGLGGGLEWQALVGLGMEGSDGGLELQVW